MTSPIASSAPPAGLPPGCGALGHQHHTIRTEVLFPVVSAPLIHSCALQALAGSCFPCDSDILFQPARHSLTQGRVVVWGLHPHTKYTFTVQSLNGVSTLSQSEPASVRVNVTTSRDGTPQYTLLTLNLRATCNHQVICVCMHACVLVCSPSSCGGSEESGGLREQSVVGVEHSSSTEPAPDP